MNGIGAGVGIRGHAIIPREGFPSYLAGLNQRMRPVTPPEGAPRGMRHRAVAVSAMMDRGSNLAGLNRRMPPVTPPENYPATLGFINMEWLDAARIMAIVVGIMSYRVFNTPINLVVAAVVPQIIRIQKDGLFSLGSDQKAVTDAIVAVIAGMISKGELW
jgi:hypothetical protein